MYKSSAPICILTKKIFQILRSEQTHQTIGPVRKCTTEWHGMCHTFSNLNMAALPKSADRISNTAACFLQRSPKRKHKNVSCKGSVKFFLEYFFSIFTTFINRKCKHVAYKKVLSAWAHLLGSRMAIIEIGKLNFYEYCGVPLLRVEYHNFFFALFNQHHSFLSWTSSFRRISM